VKFFNQKRPKTYKKENLKKKKSFQCSLKKFVNLIQNKWSMCTSVHGFISPLFLHPSAAVTAAAAEGLFMQQQCHLM